MPILSDNRRFTQERCTSRGLIFGIGRPTRLGKGETPERKVQIGGAKGRTIERTSATAIFESLTRRVGWSLKHGQANSLDEAYVFLCFIRGIINYLAARVK